LFYFAEENKSLEIEAGGEWW